MAALAGVGVGGAIGGIAGALIGMGIAEYEANRYEGRVKDGGILLSIHCDDRNWTAKPNRSWYATGAQDVAYTGESAADWQKSDKPLPRASLFVAETRKAADHLSPLPSLWSLVRIVVPRTG